MLKPGMENAGLNLQGWKMRIRSDLTFTYPILAQCSHIATLIQGFDARLANRSF